MASGYFLPTGITRRTLLGLTCALPWVALPQSSNTAEEYRVYTERPRLFLRANRLRLLRRERQRGVVRWQQLEALLSGKAAFPEPGFALALAHQVTEQAEWAQQAAQWAAEHPQETRQVALVYDWCRDALTDEQATACRTALQQAIGKPVPTSLPGLRDHALAAVALAEDAPEASGQALRRVAQGWRGGWQKQMQQGQLPVPGAATYALFELLHALRDNLQVDLREDLGKRFQALPSRLLLEYYPAPLETGGSLYRIPRYTGTGSPDLQAAALARAAELSLVAYDNNATESQFLQGWLMHDRFLLHSPFGVPYELLWANPYQPGLSYTHLPLAVHEPLLGSLRVRSTWNEDAHWFAFDRSGIQVATAQGIRAGSLADIAKPLVLGPHAMVQSQAGRVQLPSEGLETVFVFGLEPNALYDIKSEGHELVQGDTDVVGILPIALEGRAQLQAQLSRATKRLPVKTDADKKGK